MVVAVFHWFVAAEHGDEFDAGGIAYFQLGVVVICAEKEEA